MNPSDFHNDPLRFRFLIRVGRGLPAIVMDRKPRAIELPIHADPVTPTIR